MKKAKPEQGPIVPPDLGLRFTVIVTRADGTTARHDDVKGWNVQWHGILQLTFPKMRDKLYAKGQWVEADIELVVDENTVVQ